MAEDEMVGWHHWLNGHEFEQPPGVSDGQRNLVCCSPWGHKELDTTGWLNWAETKPNSLCLLSCSVISDSSRSHGLYPASVLCPWDFFFFFPGKNTGMGSTSSSKASPWPRNQTRLSCTAGGCFIAEPWQKPPNPYIYEVFSKLLHLQINFILKSQN